MDVQKPFIGPVGGGSPAGFPPVGEIGGNCTWLGGGGVNIWEILLTLYALG